MFAIQLPFVTKATTSEVYEKIEEIFGDQFAHGKNQAAVSWPEFEKRLSYVENKEPQQPTCFLIHAPGFWEPELSDRTNLVKKHCLEIAKATLPLYVYALKQGASYKVAISSRFLPEFFSQEKGNNWDYYKDLLSELSNLECSQNLSLFYRSTYSCDLISMLKVYKNAGYGVYKVLP